MPKRAIKKCVIQRRAISHLAATYRRTVHTFSPRCVSLSELLRTRIYVLLLNRSVVSRCIINPSSYWLGPKAQRKNTKVTPRSLIIICTIYYLVLLITYSSHRLLHLFWASVSMCAGIMCKHSCMCVCRCVTGDYVDPRWPFPTVPRVTSSLSGATHTVYSWAEIFLRWLSVVFVDRSLK